MCASPRLLPPPAIGEAEPCAPSPRAAELVHHLDRVRAVVRNTLYDVAVIGAGPAGLTTAVRAAAGGLHVVVVDAHALGGKLRANPNLENHLGFPPLISGPAWMSRAVAHAQQLGVEALVPAEVVRLRPERDALRLLATEGRVVRARSVVVATGTRPRRPAVPGLEAFEGRGLWYWASRLQARRCSGQEVALLAGTESAAEAAMLLARFATRVFVLVRTHGAVQPPWIDRLRTMGNVELRTGAQLVQLSSGSGGRLAAVRWRSATDREEQRPIRNLFVAEGADPGSAFLRESGVALDPRGFIRTGEAALDPAAADLQTNLPGLFAIGDVRSGSVKRVDGALREAVAVADQLRAFLTST